MQKIYWDLLKKNQEESENRRIEIKRTRRDKKRAKINAKGNRKKSKI